MTRSPRRLTGIGLALAGLAAVAVTPFAFSAASAATLLAGPTSLTPNDSAFALPHEVRKSLELHWSGVTGAQGYAVEVGTDSDWSDAPVYRAKTVSTTLVLPVWLPHASYVWRVAALQTGGHGRWSTGSAEFTRGWRDAVRPLTPASGSVLSGRPTFSWNPVRTASAYELQVSTSPTFSAPGTGPTDTSPSPSPQGQAPRGTDTCFTSHTSVTPFTSQASHKEDNPGPCVFALLGTGAQLYWRVRPLDRYVGASQDVETTPAATGISYLPPASAADDPDISATCPGSAPVASATPTASTSATPSASAAPAAGGCTPTHPVEAGQWTAGTAFRATYAAPAGGYSASRLVTTSTLAADPSGVCKSIPDSRHALCSDVPTLHWSAAPGASRYRVYVSLTDNYDNIQRIVETSALQWTPTDAWRDSTPDLSYFYAVQACTDTGCGAVTSTPPSFRKQSPRVALSAPANAARLGGGPVRLSWRDYADDLVAVSGTWATTEAYAYHVQVTGTGNPDFQTEELIEDVTVDATTWTSDTLRYPDGALLWRVQAVDASGHKLPFSTPRYFVHDSTAPRVTLSPTSGLAVKGTVTATFSETVTPFTPGTFGLSPAVPVTVTTSGRTVKITPTSPLVLGAIYTLKVNATVRDLSGNALALPLPRVRATIFGDDTTSSFTYGSGWTVGYSSSARGGRFHTSSPSTSSPTSAKVWVSGTALSVLSCKGPSNGYLDVYVDGVRKAHVDTYRSYSGCGITVATLTGLVKSTHRVELRGTGARRSASKGAKVQVDGINTWG